MSPCDVGAAAGKHIDALRADMAQALATGLFQAAAREGKITQAESNLVANAVRLDDIPVSQVLTPRPVAAAHARLCKR